MRSKMNKDLWEKYLIDSERTNIGLGWREDYLHGSVGLMTEMGEILNSHDDVNRMEELGDMYWYIALCWRALKESGFYNGRSEFFSYNEHPAAITDDLDTATSSDTFTTSMLLMMEMMENLDNAKKARYYNAPKEKLKISHFSNVCLWVEYLMNAYGYNHDAVLTANINKLKKRYPDKFTSEDAVNRNLDEERTGLEGDLEAK